MLAPLLDHLAESDEGLALVRDGGEAFCSSSLRPFLLAALLAHAGEPRPAVVVAPDDRAAGELAGDLASWLAPRRVRFYPSRGVTYESHLAPPPHLVGLRIAALDALREEAESAPVVVVSAVALSEKVRSDSISMSNSSTRTARSAVAPNTSRRPPRTANWPRSSTCPTRS